MSGVGKNIFRFGVFEADANSGELRKAGVRLRLQEQPFQVLMLFLERPGEVITREEIQQKLWPADTFVDFDHSLNTIINKIREALNDSATNPRFIETLAKRGYRFLAAVEKVGIQPDSRVEQPPMNGLAQKESAEKRSNEKFSSQSRFRLTRMEEVPAASRGSVRALFLLIQIMYLIFYVVALARLTAIQNLLDGVIGGHPVATIIVVLSASIGVPVRLFLLSAASFDIVDLGQKFRRLFPAVLVLDELWALSPFFLSPQIGWGFALAITAALIYLPFAQRSLVLMRDRGALLESAK
jgi:cholera toxin transcriptional activator